MNQNSVADVTSAKAKVNKSAKGIASSPVRLRAQSRAKLDALVARINKDRAGRRVKPDDLICYSLDLLTDQHLQEIGARLLTNKIALSCAGRWSQRSILAGTSRWRIHSWVYFLR